MRFSKVRQLLANFQFIPSSSLDFQVGLNLDETTSLNQSLTNRRIVDAGHIKARLYGVGHGRGWCFKQIFHTTLNDFILMALLCSSRYVTAYVKPIYITSVMNIFITFFKLIVSPRQISPLSPQRETNESGRRHPLWLLISLFSCLDIHN